MHAEEEKVADSPKSYLSFLGVPDMLLGKEL